MRSDETYKEMKNNVNFLFINEILIFLKVHISCPVNDQVFDSKLAQLSPVFTFWKKILLPTYCGFEWYYQSYWELISSSNLINNCNVSTATMLCVPQHYILIRIQNLGWKNFEHATLTRSHYCCTRRVRCALCIFSSDVQADTLHCLLST